MSPLSLDFSCGLPPGCLEPLKAALSLAGAGVEPANRSGYPTRQRMITNAATVSKIPRLIMSSASKRQPVFFSHLFGPFWTARCIFFISVSPRLKKNARYCDVVAGMCIRRLKKPRFNIAKNRCSLMLRIKGKIEIVKFIFYS